MIVQFQVQAADEKNCKVTLLPDIEDKKPTVIEENTVDYIKGVVYTALNAETYLSFQKYKKGLEEAQKGKNVTVNGNS